METQHNKAKIQRRGLSSPSTHQNQLNIDGSKRTMHLLGARTVKPDLLNVNGREVHEEMMNEASRALTEAFI